MSADEALEIVANGREIGGLIESLGAFVYIKDRKNRTLRVNQAVADSFDVTPQEMANTPSEFWYPSTADEYHSVDRSLIRTGQAVLNIIEPIPSPRDRNRIFVTGKFPIMGRGHEVVGVLVVARPTDERLDEESLEDLPRRLKKQGLLIDSSRQTDPEILDLLTVLQGHIDLALFEQTP